MTTRMLIDATHEEETRVAIVHGNRVEEFDYESSAKKQIKGNIYLAKITRVEPSLQAAFVEYGGNRHGFLAFSEIHPDYYQIPVSDREELIAEEAAAYAKLLEEDEEVPEKKPKRKPRRRANSNKDKKQSDDAKEADNSESSNEETSDNSSNATDSVSETALETTDTSQDTPEPIETTVLETDNNIVKDAVESSVESSKTGDDSQDDDAPRNEPVETAKADNGDNIKSEPEQGTDKPSITKAESVSFSDTITGDVDSDDSTDNTEAVESEDDAEDETETVGSHVFDDEEAEERLRVKIAKGLRRRYKIQEVIKKNQVVLIQVVKEERGNKGAALTTYLSLPGRYCVLMPNTLHSGGVSRKIANISERKSLKKILSDLDMPSGISCIIRTAGQSRTKTEIKRDFDYLIRTWEGIRERTLKSVAPHMINEEGDLTKRSIRDLYTREIDEILVEGEEGYKTARGFMRLLMPSHAKKIKHYTDKTPLLHRFQVESQLDSMYSPTVQLKSGGYIVINPTEALVSIDVNSGKATKGHNIEETARKTNLEAAEEVARQLRLRDMAGLIVIDFIDMEVRGNNRAVEQKLKECLKADRARIQVGKISSFGLLEMSRQRLRAGVLESSTRSCPHCEGSGLIRSVETQVLHILRALEEEGIKDRNDKVTVFLPEQTAIYMLNNKRAKLVSLEEQYKMVIEVAIDTSLTESSYKLEMANSDSKNAEKTRPAKQANVRTQSQQSRPDRDRSTSSRRNRQRNQSRKSRDHSQDRPQEDETIQEVATPETQDVAQQPSENQESKPRRRRRRPRRNSKGPLDVNMTENTEATISTPTNKEAAKTESAPVTTETAPAPSQGDSGEKPKPRRRPRTRRTPSEDTKTQTDSDRKEGTEETTAPETKSDQRPARRPYPPQARSRRKTSDKSKPTVQKSDAQKSNKVVSKPEATPKETAPKKMDSKVSGTKDSGTKDSGAKDEAPKKTGWWQRTFG
ncbi:MAG: Rne/Rng family ribonuclease [Emcibacter sp.]|nr:Rne/Rng family ribonuclease [Emcibacter sp.]